MLSFSADADSTQVQALVEAEDAVAVAYLDSIKLQFDASGLVLVRGGKSSALNCDFPREIYRFQRRNGFRVRPLLRNTPVVRVRHPMIPDMALSLRVLDMSIGGCAIFLPNDVPPLQPGVVLNGVEIELDIDTRVSASLRLQHVTSLNPDARGVRLGCEIVDPESADVLRALQRYIDQTQKRQRAFGALESLLGRVMLAGSSSQGAEVQPAAKSLASREASAKATLQPQGLGHGGRELRD